VKVHLHLGLWLIIGLGALYSCKRNDTQPKPIADFSLSDTLIREGDTIRVENLSKHAKSQLWYLNGVLWSEALAPVWLPVQSGRYEMELHAIGEQGQHEVLKKEFNVLPDTVWRLTEHATKIWKAVSLLYAGNEMIQFPCQQDDEVRFSYGQNYDYSFTEGKDTCTPGTYLIPMPQKGTWRYDSKRRELNCMVTEPAPLLLSFKIDSLSRSYFKGTDARNTAVLTLKH
jgi:hypothetical protein